MHLLQNTAPRAENLATPASRFGGPSSGAYGFSQPGDEGITPAPFERPAGTAGLNGGGLPGAYTDRVSSMAGARRAAQDTGSEAPPVLSMLDEGAGGAASQASAAHIPDTAETDPDIARRRGANILDTSEGFWATVFGFSPENLSAVLHELQPSASAVLAHRQGGGNWMHVRYASALDLDEALAKNGRVVHGSMVGVLAGVQPREGRTGDAAATRRAGKPTNQTVWFVPPAPAMDPSRDAVRPLAKQPGPGVRADEVASATGIRGVVMRATEYLFGW